MQLVLWAIVALTHVAGCARGYYLHDSEMCSSAPCIEVADGAVDRIDGPPIGRSGSDLSVPDLVVIHDSASDTEFISEGCPFPPSINIRDQFAEELGESSFDAGDTRGGLAPLGTLRISYTFTNQGGKPFCALRVLVRIANNCIIFNSDSGEETTGVGATYSLSSASFGDDSILSPGEQATVLFELGITGEPYEMDFFVFGTEAIP